MLMPAERLRRLIGEHGPVPFAVLMEEALYGEGGYYRRERPPMGERGDFITGSAVSDLFGRTTARLLDRLDEALGTTADLLEVGYGSGRHLAAVASSATGRRLRGYDRIQRELPAGIERLPGLEEPSPAVVGLVFSYELFDALPVHRLVGRESGGVGEIHVGLDPMGAFRWEIGDLSDPELEGLLGGAALEAGQVADLAPGWIPLYRRLASTLERGLLVTFDYGYERPGLLDARGRFHGTLACYRAHRVHRDALRDVGEQDLTAHVDFTALREAGEALGLSTVAFTRQARWLTALGLFEEIEADDLRTRQQAATLLDPEGMGDQIRVLVQARDIDAARLIDLEILG